MDSKLKVKAFLGLLSTPFVLGVPVFVAAGTLSYWEAWVFLAFFTVATSVHTLYLLKHDPELLERRMRAGPRAEKRSAQRVIMCFVLAAFFGLFIIAGLDHRFGWSHVPGAVALVGDLMVALSYGVFLIVFQANRFASATIEVAEGQKVISTGPYGLVRHPMYSGALLLMLGIPLALGSLWGMLGVLAAVPILIWRIVDEEKFLAGSLEGYTEYCNKVKYRLLPGLY